MSIGTVVFDSLQNKLNHFCSNKELLEDGSLLAILRED